MRRLTVTLLLAGCFEQHDSGSKMLGTRADMTTPAGDYAGYRVVTPCPSGIDVGVIGIGGVAITQTDAIAAGQDLHTRVSDVASVWGGGGYDAVCETGSGTYVVLYDWRDVDMVIARSGDWLREHDYALQVGIVVQGIQVPGAD
jgi:hypothetical protein